MLISMVFLLFITLAIIAGLVGPSVREFKVANDYIRSRQSLYLSESGVEDSYYRLKNSIKVDDIEEINLNGHTAKTTIVEGYNERTITSVGDVVNRERTTELLVLAGTGVSFSYGVQVGIGGMTIGNGASVAGSVYSNGSIIGTGSAWIKGTAASANSADLYADQSNGSGTPAYDIVFANTNDTEDFAQSFEVSETGQLNKVKLYLKKVGTPGNLTVRLMSDSSGNPSGTTLTSGPLSSSLVSTNYGWVEVPLSSYEELEVEATYWIVIDGSANASKYYIIGVNDDGYEDGIGKIGNVSGTWNNTSPSGLDGFFELYLGGVTGLIEGVHVGDLGEGDAYAHAVNNSKIEGNNFCQIGEGNVDENNDDLPCNTSVQDPSAIPMPISDQNILDWKTEAEAGGVHTGDFILDSGSDSIEAIKITGNLVVRNPGTALTINGHVWVEGNLVVSNNSDINLSPSYQSSEGVIVVDGTVDINQNAEFGNSGVAGSYIMVLSTSISTSAINLENNAGAVILYAANGTVNLSPGGDAKALNGKYINIQNNANVTYETGLANSNFVNGPSGGWDIVGWKEIE